MLTTTPEKIFVLYAKVPTKLHKLRTDFFVEFHYIQDINGRAWYAPDQAEGYVLAGQTPSAS